MQTASLKNSGALSLVINIEMIPFFLKFIPVSTQIDLDLGWLLFLLFPTSWPEYKMKKKTKGGYTETKTVDSTRRTDGQSTSSS